ncbi:MAG: MoaD/ThiS family protein [Asticcacaulis sp.]
MSLVLLFFGKVADKAGVRQRLYAFPDTGPDTGLSLFDLRDTVLAEAFAEGRLSRDEVRMSVNQVLSLEDCPLTEGDEVAFFSAFSGG